MKRSTQRLSIKYLLFICVILLQLRFIQLAEIGMPESIMRVEAATCQAIPVNTASVIVPVQIPASGTYKIWSRIRTQGDTANAYWLKIDSDCEIVVGNASGMQSSSFVWVGFRDGMATSSVTAPLTAGSHIITLFGKEPGTGVDSLLFTTDMNCTPNGNTCTGTTVTLPAGGTQLGVIVGLHGIGTGGDNANPTSTGTTTPKHPQRLVGITLFDSQNQQAADVSVTTIFSAQTGKFTGNAVLPSTIVSGVYTAKLHTDGYLWKVVPGILTITKNQITQLPAIALVTGDANNDNQISILDYNLLLDCYSDLLPAKNCADSGKLQSSDFTDDGKVNEFDYNLFLRELSTQGGQ